MNRMIAKSLKTALSLTVLMLTFTASYAQQPKEIPDLKYMAAKMGRLNDHTQDFLDFAQSHKGNLAEREVATTLYETASSVYECLNSSFKLLSIYHKMSCRADKEIVRSSTMEQLDYYSKEIELRISQINDCLVRTKIPAIVTSGTQLKDDLREIKTRFASIKFN